MAKSKTKLKVEGNVISGTVEDIDKMLEEAKKLLSKNESPYIITSAHLKEMKCVYGYEIKDGATAGDKIPSRKGDNLIHEDLRKAFESLTPHLAILDDAFKLLKDIETFEEKAEHEIIYGYFITGFKVMGTDENIGYVLVGDKSVSQGGIAFETPKVTITSGYEYYSKLKEAIEHVRNEVFLYMNGKCEKDDSPQLAMQFGGGNENDDNEFNNPE